MFESLKRTSLFKAKNESWIKDLLKMVPVLSSNVVWTGVDVIKSFLFVTDAFGQKARVFDSVCLLSVFNRLSCKVSSASNVLAYLSGASVNKKKFI
jgi:hypothetical protein